MDISTCHAVLTVVYIVWLDTIYFQRLRLQHQQNIVSHKSTVMSTTDFMRKTTVDTPSERQVVDIDQAISKIKT